MTQSIKAYFDGKVFVPDEDIDLAPGSAVQLTVSDSAGDSHDAESQAFLESRRKVLALARELAQGVGPRDWKRDDLYEG